MTEREKLIDILSTTIYPRIGADPAEAVADFLLDNGVIVPPVKVGNLVYSFVDCFGVVLPFVVEQIIIDYNEKEPLVTICANCYNDENDELLADIDFEYKDIGVTVFLTREKAEVALLEDKE